MKKLIKSGLLVAGVSIMLTVPAYAYTGNGNGGNGGLGNGMGNPKSGAAQSGIGIRANGTGMRDGTKIRSQGARSATDHDVSVYGTGTGSQFRNVNAGVPGMANRNVDGYGARTYADGATDGAYRTRAAAAPARGMRWGWLGLLGLLGLAGMRKRNPQDNR